MNRRLAAVLVVVAAAVAGIFFLFKRPVAPAPQPIIAPEVSESAQPAKPGSAARANPNPTPAEPQLPAPAAAAPADSAAPASAPAPRIVASPAPAAVEPLPADLADLPAATVLENMRTSVRNYGSTFGGNPIGTNQEITRALNGENPKQIKFLKDDGNRINANGELVDIWGTPYFFHQLAATDMEIRSAGPDRKMYTSDDLVTK